MCAPSLVEIAPGVPELCPDIHTHTSILYRYRLAHFPGAARVFIYPSLIVMCVPSLAEIVHLDGIFSITTSTLVGGTLPTRRLIYIITVFFFANRTLVNIRN
jgi:hypothetical protein